LYKLLFFWGKWLNPHVNQTQNYHNYKPTFNQYCIQSYVLYLQYIGQIIWTYCLFIKYFSNL